LSTAVEIMLKRTSIRRFTKHAVGEDVLNRILLVGQRAPSPGGFQAYSLIIVDDAEKLSKIGEATRQTFITKAPVFILVCVDMRKFRKVLDHLGHDYHLKHGQGLYAKLFSIVEASMVAQSMATAALLMGLGSCFVGAVFYAMKDVSELLDLPQGVIPLLGLCVGYAEESPPLRPRWPLATVVHRNKYRETTTEEIDNYLRLADEAMEQEEYYQKYSGRETTYTEHLKWKTQATEWISEHDKSARDFLVRNGLALT
jgi:FMN reductase (NADPH)